MDLLTKLNNIEKKNNENKVLLAKKEQQLQTLQEECEGFLSTCKEKGFLPEELIQKYTNLEIELNDEIAEAEDILQ